MSWPAERELSLSTVQTIQRGLQQHFAYHKQYDDPLIAEGKSLWIGRQPMIQNS
ncbi:Hypothetical protein P9303_17931 [Prochlorococcus marinus str. MIT 9303]|uniref:Uncharacterized protein n=1 Tax=Prochlorococcus marinus (strain MIT 9303) TaxID=59922 RepID=A2CAM5_PROM3|nr:Hypothetical protein P9303_17931 [Prochlorococcus marinus str. MIT 9303]